MRVFSVSRYHKFLIIFLAIGIMASKRAGSKYTVESSNRDMVEQGSMSFPVYTDTHMFIDKDIKITWKDINNTFSSNFEENL